MRQFGRLISIITWLLVAGSLVVITGGLFGRPLLLAAVPTTSMTPVLRPGDLIVVLPTWVTGPPGLGDIVVYKTEEDQDWIVHRIVDGNPSDGYVLKGDANPVADSVIVYPKDIAGVVPQFSGKAMAFRRLGLVKLDEGPLSSPVVAGLALVLGVYLLVLDMRPRISRFTQGRRTVTQRNGATLSIYLGLAITVFVTTLVPAWTLSRTDRIQFEVVTTWPSHVKSWPGRYLLGQVHHEKLELTNKSPVPIVVVSLGDHPDVEYLPSRTVVWPRQTRTLELTVFAREPGKHFGELRTGVFLPLLPPTFIEKLARVHVGLAAVAVALVPTVLVASIALMDVRSRAALQRIKTRLALKLPT